jgi:hypothetical protein
MKKLNEMKDFNYPKLEYLEGFFSTQIHEKGTDVSRTVLIVCQHLLEPQKQCSSHL